MATYLHLWKKYKKMRRNFKERTALKPSTTFISCSVLYTFGCWIRTIRRNGLSIDETESIFYGIWTCFSIHVKWEGFNYIHPNKNTRIVLQKANVSKADWFVKWKKANSCIHNHSELNGHAQNNDSNEITIVTLGWVAMKCI